MSDDGNHTGHLAQASLPPVARALVAGMLDDIELGFDAIMTMDAADGSALLDELAAKLARSRTRVLRVAASSPGNLTLAGLLAQLCPVAREVEHAPEQGIEALVRLDPSCDRIVLLLSNAEALEQGALRAIQLAADAQPQLRLVLAGTPPLLAALEHPDLSQLHGRFSRARGRQEGDEHQRVVPPAASATVAAPPRPRPANDAAGINKLVAAAVAVVAVVALGVAVSHTGAGTAAVTRPAAALLEPADTKPTPPKARSPAQTVSQDPPRGVAVIPDGPAATVIPTVAPPVPSPAPPVASQQAETLPPAAPAQHPAAAQQASLPLLPRHREPAARRPAGPNGRSVAEAQSLWLQDHPSYRRPDPRPPVRYEPRQQQDGSAWPLAADEPRGTIGTYSSGPGGIRSFRYGP